MATKEMLEEALQTAWSLDDLEVYGDHLLGEGDPRGDLLALDRHPAPEDASWRQRRHAALARWLGPELVARCSHLVQHGFVHELRCSMHAPELLDTALGTFVRGYAIWGAHPRVGASLVHLAAQPRPWLKRLAIAYWGTLPYPSELAAKLIAATPNLEELHLIGRPVFRELMHPHVKRVVLEQGMTIALPDVERERRTSIEWSTGWPVPPEDLELVQQIAGDLADWNLIVDWYGEAFAEPMPALLVRLAAAGLLQLDGTVVRRPLPYTGPGWEGIYRDWTLRIDVGVAPEVNLGSIRAHAYHLAGCMFEARLMPEAAEALAQYLELLQSLGAWYPQAEREPRRVMRSMVPQLALAFDTLLERRALLEEPRGPNWVPIDTFAGMLALSGAHRRVELRIV